VNDDEVIDGSSLIGFDCDEDGRGTGEVDETKGSDEDSV
jgi:hypothetical protein